MNTQTTTTGIASIKPKRKYTKRKQTTNLPRTARAYLTREYNLKMETEYAAVSKLIEIDASKKDAAWAWPKSEDQPKKPINLTGWRGWVVQKLLGKVEIYNV
jgi:hypothetical protein